MSSFGQTPHLFLKTLFVKSFRNLSEIDVSFSPSHNLFIGPNGHGKTNCLEAIALACSLRPMQTLQNVDLIKFDEPQAKVKGSFSGTQTMEVDIDIFERGKKAKINDQPINSAAKLSRAAPLVSFIPIELNMIVGGANLRRRALDQVAAMLYFEHFTALKSYERLLLHRNRLLKDWPLDRPTLDTFTDLLIKVGAELIFFRLKTIEQMATLFADKTEEILGLGHRGKVSYLVKGQDMSGHTIADLMALLTQEKALIGPQELKRKITLFGPHLDDVIFEINGVNAKRFASRAQTRAIVLAFKLAQMITIHQIRGIAPIIILDDIVSELDSVRKDNLIELINGLGTQAFFSTTDLATFGGRKKCEYTFNINDGCIA